MTRRQCTPILQPSATHAPLPPVRRISTSHISHTSDRASACRWARGPRARPPRTPLPSCDLRQPRPWQWHGPPEHLRRLTGPRACRGPPRAPSPPPRSRCFRGPGWGPPCNAWGRGEEVRRERCWCGGRPDGEAIDTQTASVLDANSGPSQLGVETPCNLCPESHAIISFKQPKTPPTRQTSALSSHALSTASVATRLGRGTT